ncbi:MAG: arginine--tRNA ligase [Candidatus Omnitrophica bacterium]|nr:arginine--tRNA ligase [Candidatus Omnitrophota bacterium]
MEDLRQPLQRAIWQALTDARLDSYCSLQDIELEFAPAPGFGDISNNICLRLAKKARKAPPAIATEVCEKLSRNLKGSRAEDCIKEVKAEGAGFINFYLTDSYLRSVLADLLVRKEDFGRSDTGKGEKVMIEFVSANPTGPLSVAHARQAAVGDALANILSFLGCVVSKEYYLNDEGNQINILGNSVKLRLAEANGETVEFPENHYQGDYIADMARRIKEKKIKVEDFSDYAANAILDVIKQELADFRVSFDCWYSQKGLRTSGKIQQAFEQLKAKGLLYEQEGATWFKSTQFADDKDRVVIKSDGTYTYLAPDIAYHEDKYRRGFTMLVNLWGPDHHGYISRLKASVAAMGRDPESLSIVIVQLATIFRDGKAIEMSTRKGQYITLREVLDEVGVDASRFFFLMRRTASHLNFDLETAKKQTPENPVYYVQYAHARISSILRQAQLRQNFPAKDLEALKEPEELALIKKLWQFSYVLQVCRTNLDPYMLTVYLQELATVFHRFYDRHRVLGTDEALSQARLALALGTKTVLATGLKLIGVSAPEKM